jgi:hypothetical protein
MNIHDQDTPGNGPLLRPNDTATLTGRCQFGDVNGDLGGANTHGQAVDESTNDEHGDVLGRTDEDGADTPDDGTRLDGSLATKNVREEAGKQGANEGSARHGGSDATLNRSSWA